MNVILASQSPRRRLLLAEMGVDFEVIPSQFEEYFDENRTPEEVAEELALGKALDVARAHPDDIVIGSDSIVVFKGEQLGKPEDEREAIDRIKQYCETEHQVVSSLAVVCLSKNYQSVTHESTSIKFANIPDEVIEAYVKTGDPMDKAGAYAIQHPMILPYVERIDGNLDTHIGFPTHSTQRYLEELGVDCQAVEITLVDLSDPKYQV